MTFTKQVQVSFAGGELSPRMFGRTDLGRYRNALATCQNFITRKQGVAQRRPGTKYVAACKGQAISDASTSNKAVRLIPFKYSTDEQYVLEFGGKNGSALNIVSAASGAAGAGSFVVATNVTSTFPWKRRFTVAGNHANNNGVYTVRHSVYSAPNTTIVVNEAVSNTTGATGTITPHVGYIRFYRYDSTTGENIRLTDSGSGNPTEVTSIWDETQIGDIKFCQSASYLYLVHPDFRPQTLVRQLYDSNHEPAYVDSDNGAWTLSSFFASAWDGPWLPVNTTAITMSYSDSTNRITASSATFSARDVGRLVRIFDEEGTPGEQQPYWMSFQISSVVSTTVVAVTKQYGTSEDDISATAIWRLGAWADESQGWPRTCQFHQERIWFGGTYGSPQTVWSSNTDDYTNFRPSAVTTKTEWYVGEVFDFQAITRTLSDNEVNEIYWLKSDAQGLLCMTNSGVFLLAGVDDALMTPSNNRMDRHNSRGAASQPQPRQMGNAVLYIGHDTKSVKELAYDSSVGKYQAPDMTLLADHIALAGITDTAEYSYPDDILWCVDNDGTLLGMTYEREEEVVGWHKHVIGGSFSSGQAVVESITSVRRGNFDELWLVVKRTVDSQTVRYVEYMKPYHEIGDDHEDAFYVDCGITYDSTSTTTITGLDHLEGQTVSVLGDGLTQATKVVASGQITIATAASVVQVGLSYTSTGTTLPLYPQLGVDDSRGNKMRVAKAFLSLHLSQGGTFGVDSTLDSIEYPDTNLTSSVLEVTVPGQSELECQVTFQQTDPQPMTVRSITFEMVSG